MLALNRHGWRSLLLVDMVVQSLHLSHKTTANNVINMRTIIIQNEKIIKSLRIGGRRNNNVELKYSSAGCNYIYQISTPPWMYPKSWG
jgi:hypothetical protein